MTVLVGWTPPASARRTDPAVGPSRSRTLVQATAGGLVTQAAFPDRSWWPVALLGIVLLVLALRRDSARWAALVGLTWGSAFFLPHVWWASQAAERPLRTSLTPADILGAAPEAAASVLALAGLLAGVAATCRRGRRVR